MNARLFDEDLAESRAEQREYDRRHQILTCGSGRGFLGWEDPPDDVEKEVVAQCTVCDEWMLAEELSQVTMRLHLDAPLRKDRMCSGCVKGYRADGALVYEAEK